MLFARALARLVRIGRLELIDAGGERHVCVGAPGPAVTVRLHDRSLYWKFVVNPRLYVAEAYMDGALTVEEGSLYDFVELLVLNAQEGYFLLRLTELLAVLKRRFDQYNPVPRAQRNAAHHYDLSEQLYELFLDHDRQYSCAYFFSPSDDLEDRAAQQEAASCVQAAVASRPEGARHRLRLGRAGALSRAANATSRSPALRSRPSSIRSAQRRAAAAGLSDRVHFQLRDYREETGRYDRIVSVGMFEHVGVNHYLEFFSRVKNLLQPDGVTLLHSIGRMDGPASTNPWLRKYIFPGGYCPALSEVLPVVEKAWNCGSPISRFCGCITPRRCARGAPALTRTATGFARSMTSASAGCGKYIWSAAR